MSQNYKSDAYSETYFNTLYSDNTDPWHYQTRWYEKRKRDICLAVLPQANYASGIELGCGNGVFSKLLAARCQTLLSVDGNNQAVYLAKKHLVETSNVTVIQGVIPSILSTLNTTTYKANFLADDLSANKLPFNLIVISEILYYLSPADIETVITWIKQNLATGGTLLCCHWRYAIDGFKLTGEMVHKRLHQTFNKDNKLNLTHQSQITDSDFLLDVWQNSTQTVARLEKLI